MPCHRVCVRRKEIKKRNVPDGREEENFDSAGHTYKQRDRKIFYPLWSLFFLEYSVFVYMYARIIKNSVSFHLNRRQNKNSVIIRECMYVCMCV